MIIARGEECSRLELYLAPHRVRILLSLPLNHENSMKKEENKIIILKPLNGKGIPLVGIVDKKSPYIIFDDFAYFLK